MVQNYQLDVGQILAMIIRDLESEFVLDSDHDLHVVEAVEAEILVYGSFPVPGPELPC
jgi:hypothetical protein